MVTQTRVVKSFPCEVQNQPWGARPPSGDITGQAQVGLGLSLLSLCCPTGLLAVTQTASSWVEWRDSRQEPTQDHLTDRDLVRCQQKPIGPARLLDLPQVSVGAFPWEFHTPLQS